MIVKGMMIVISSECGDSYMSRSEGMMMVMVSRNEDMRIAT